MMKKFLHFCFNPKVLAVILGLSIIAVIMGMVIAIKWQELAPVLLVSLPIIILVACMVICPLAMIFMAKKMSKDKM